MNVILADAIKDIKTIFVQNHITKRFVVHYYHKYLFWWQSNGNVYVDFMAFNRRGFDWQIIDMQL